MLEFDDIQHILLTRTPAMTGRYEFLSFDNPAGGRAWLAELLDRVQSASAPAPPWTTPSGGSQWRSLGTVCVRWEWTRTRWQRSPEFREGMAARAGDTV